MKFYINVSKGGQHFFATATHSCTNPGKAKQVFTSIRKRFPESEGFKVEIYRVQKTGQKVTESFL